jgi:hypothetical protein
MKIQEAKICLAPNFPNYKQDCIEQCDDCKKFQSNMKHPKKVTLEERKKIKESYENMLKILEKSKL